MSVGPKNFCRVCGDNPNLCGHYSSDSFKPYGESFMYNKDVTISELEHEIKKLKDDLEKQTSARKSEESARQFYVDQVTKLKADREVLLVELKNAVEAGEFFSRHADCRRDTWACRCSFCKDTESSKKLRLARQTLKSIGEIE